MSTPVFEETKHATEEDMQHRIQRMIELQNEEMKMSQQGIKEIDEFYSGYQSRSGSSSRGSTSRGEPPETTAATMTSVPIISNNGNESNAETTTATTSTSSLLLGSKTLSRSVGLSSLHDLHELSLGDDDGGGLVTGNYSNAVADALGQPSLPPPPMTSDMNQSHATVTRGNSAMVFPTDEQGVGLGTLYFNTEKHGSAASAAPQSVSTTEDSRLMMIMPFAGRHVESAAGTSAYGSVGDGLPPSSSLPENPQFHSLPQQQQQQQQQQQRFLSGGCYPGYSDTGSSQYDYALPKQQQQQQQQQRQPTRRSQQRHQNSRVGSVISAVSMCCSCLWKMIYMFFCCCSTDAIEEQQLHRSFCYGAIDGMLTGSGIVAAFCGMDVLAPTSNLAVRSFVVAFSAAACFADSLCMALGHVWTTHVLVTASAKERAEQRLAMEQNRADAKGQLVDMLLERGMLKIDAMSLADTLEGYPDMFVSALVGDALIAGGIGKSAESSSDLNNRHRSASGSGDGGAGGANRAWNTHHQWGGARGDLSPRQLDDQRSGGSIQFWKFPSYGHHINELEQEVDSEAAFVGTAMTESRREGLMMMLGFSLFAVVPSLIYLTVPMMLGTEHHIKSSAHSAATSAHTGMEQAIAANDQVDIAPSGISTSSIIITTAAVIMWCLGVWKSQFVDSNWMLFGIETVVVLLVCVCAAYGLGALLAACIPDLDASILNDSGSSEKESL